MVGASLILMSGLGTTTEKCGEAVWKRGVCWYNEGILYMQKQLKQVCLNSSMS